jgi:hypothetical protein
LPREINNNLSNDIRIVSYGGEIQDPKRVASRGLVSRGRPPLAATSDPIPVPMPKYNYSEDRPQTRGNGTAGTRRGTRGALRQKRTPHVLEALSSSTFRNDQLES